MLAAEARQLAGKRYSIEINSIQQQIVERAKLGFFSLVVTEPISDYARAKLADDGYALSKSINWEDIISW